MLIMLMSLLRFRLVWVYGNHYSSVHMFSVLHSIILTSLIHVHTGANMK